MTKSHLTTGEVAALFGVTDWQVRRAVDSLGAQIPRAGQYRLVPRELLGQLAIAMQQRGFMHPPALVGPIGGGIQA